MQSAKKSTRILSALSMAAAAVITAKTAHAASLTLYYGQDTSYANSNNGVFIGTGYTSSGGKDTQGQFQALKGTVTTPTLNLSGPTTITLPVGSYLSLAIDAVVTGAANASSVAGTSKQSDFGAQPSFLGLAELGLTIGSSDLTGAVLTPVGGSSTPSTTISGIPAYSSTGAINAVLGANGGAAANAYSIAPSWTAVHSAGLVQPNEPGFDTTPNSNGGVGTAGTSPGAFPAGGNTGGATGSVSGATKAGLEQFASATNTASYSQATEFIDSLLFQGLKPGTVTLSPTVVAGSTEYWQFASTANKEHQYAATKFGTNDTLGTLPVLVINVGSVGPTSHPIINYSAGPGSPVAGYGSQVATLTVTGSGGSYTVAQASFTAPGDATGTVEAKTFSPASNEEIYALDVLVNGTQATSTQLGVLVAAINSGDSAVGKSIGVVATTSSPSPDPFAKN